MCKNILIITSYFPQQNSIASLRPYSWAKYWSKMGHNITVLTTTKNKHDNDLNLGCSDFEIIEVENRFKANIRKKVIGDKSKVLITDKNSEIFFRSKVLNKVKEFVEKRGLLGTARMPDFNDFIISDSVNSVKNKQFDMMISTSGPYTEHIIAQKLKKQNKDIFWIADYRDLWTQNHIFKGLFPFTLVEEYLEKKINNSADMITTVSEPLAKQIRDKYKIKNVETIENGFDFEDLNNISKENYWSDDKIRLVYTGSIYKGKQDPSPLFEAIEAISKSNDKKLLDKLEVIFVGGSKADLDELIEKYTVQRWVGYGGFLPREDSLRMQRDADALIFLEFEAKGVDGILTGKLFEYICSGTQILGIGVTNNSTPGKLISSSGHGINFGKDRESIKKYLLELLNSNTKYVFIKNIEIIEKYSRKKQAEKILDLVNEYEKQL